MAVIIIRKWISDDHLCNLRSLSYWRQIGFSRHKLIAIHLYLDWMWLLSTIHLTKKKPYPKKNITLQFLRKLVGENESILFSWEYYMRYSNNSSNYIKNLISSSVCVHYLETYVL